MGGVSNNITFFVKMAAISNKIPSGNPCNFGKTLADKMACF